MTVASPAMAFALDVGPVILVYVRGHLVWLRTRGHRMGLEALYSTLLQGDIPYWLPETLSPLRADYGAKR